MPARVFVDEFSASAVCWSNISSLQDVAAAPQLFSGRRRPHRRHVSTLAKGTEQLPWLEPDISLCIPWVCLYVSHKELEELMLKASHTAEKVAKSYVLERCRKPGNI